MKRRAV